MMNKFARVVITATVIFAAACSATTQSSLQGLRGELVGGWRMTSLEVGTAAGGLQTVPYSGQVIFTEAGTMSVQAMDPAVNPQPSPYTVNGYEAFYGPVVIDYSNRTFVVTVESSAVRKLIGQKMQRSFEVSGNRLVLLPANPEERFRATYERYSR